MTYIEQGLYRTLLDEIWLKGSIPDDLEGLAEICFCPLDVMQNAWKRLGRCFYEVKPGVLSNDKLDSIMFKQQKLREMQSAKGKQSAARRWGSSVTDTTDVTGITTVTPVEPTQQSLTDVTIREEKSREEKSTEEKNPSSLKGREILNIAENCVFGPPRVTDISHGGAVESSAHAAGSGSSIHAIPKEDAIGPLVEAAWRYFLERTGRHADQYKLTPERRTMGRRGMELLTSFAKQRNHPEPAVAAVELFQIAVDRMVSSPFHAGQNDRGRQYLDWHHLFAGKGYPSPRKLLEFWLDDARWPA